MISARHLVLTVALAYGFTAFPAVPGARAETRIVRNYTVEDGLTQTYANILAEDHEGYLWVGTEGGVSRFDGTEFTNYQSGDGLPTGLVFAVHPISHPALRAALGGDLLVGTANGLAIWRDGGFTALPAGIALRDGVRALAETPDGRLLLSRQSHVDVFSPGGRIEPLPLGDASERPAAVLATRGGTLLVGKGPRLFEVRGRSVRRFGQEDGLGGDVLALRESRDGRVWIGTTDGLSVWRSAGGKGELARDPKINDGVQAIEEGRDGTLYLGTVEAGLHILRDGVVDSISTEHGLLWNGVFAIRETRGGAVYIGTGRGVSVYHRDILRSWTLLDGLPDLVWSIVHDHRGTWLGTGRGLALLSDGKIRLFDRRHGLPNESIRDLLLDRAGRFWFATEEGVAILEKGRDEEPGTGRLRILGQRDGLPGDYVRALWEALDGAVWMATQEGVAIWRDGRIIRTLTRRDGMPGRVVTSITGAPDGSVWIGTWGGLVQVTGGAENPRLRSWRKQDGLSDEIVWSVRSGPNGTIWAGTARGLSVFRDGRFRTIDTRLGLTNDTIYCMEEDVSGRLYLSTNRGVNVLDLGNNGEGRPGAEPVVRTLRRRDGLGSDEGNLGACSRDAGGRIWFGNVAGASIYDPVRDPPNRPTPRVHISRLRLFGVDLPMPRGPRVFQNHENYFGLSFVGIDLTAPHSVRYRYRLDGLDRDWIGTERREVQYTNLDPGDYRFEVQAASAGSRWSESAVLGFTIETPLWQRWWFLLLTALATAALIGWLFTLRVRQLLAIERLRTALAADLHDHIGTGLTEIAILSEIANHRASQGAHPEVAAPPPELSRVADTARQLVDRMNDIVWLVNPRRDSLHELFLRLKDSYAELFSHSGVLFRTTNLRLFENVRLSMDYRQNLYLIFKEALHNSLRHSGCQEIELSVAVHGRRLEVVLRDDGRGFDPEGSFGGNGLENMRTRAARIGGALRIDASPARGTSICFEGSLG
jgi:ligand-binding sensor domain-containing protein